MEAIKQKTFDDNIKVVCLFVSVCVFAFGTYVVFGLHLFFWAGMTSLWLLLAFMFGIFLNSLLLKRPNTLVDTPLIMLISILGISVLTCFLLLFEAQAIGIKIVDQVGSFQITTKHLHTALFTISFFLVLTMFVYAFLSIKREKTQLKKMLMNASGEIVVWQGNVGKIRLDRLPFPRHKQQWLATSSDTFSVGDRVRVTGMDDREKKLQVAKITLSPSQHPILTGIDRIGYTWRLLFFVLVMSSFVLFLSFSLILMPFYFSLS